jgi:hypothetical protein
MDCELKIEHPCYGNCFRQTGRGSYVKRKDSNCDCVLHPCPKCRQMYPNALLMCCEGYCQNCAVQVCCALGYVQKKLGIKEIQGKEYLQKFADLMAEFFNYQKDLKN